MSIATAQTDMIGDRLDVFLCGQFVDHQLLLEGSAQAQRRSPSRRQSRESDAVQIGGAFYRLDEARQDVEQRAE